MKAGMKADVVMVIVLQAVVLWCGTLQEALITLVIFYLIKICTLLSD